MLLLKEAVVVGYDEVRASSRVFPKHLLSRATLREPLSLHFCSCSCPCSCCYSCSLVPFLSESHCTVFRYRSQIEVAHRYKISFSRKQTPRETSPHPTNALTWLDAAQGFLHGVEERRALWPTWVAGGGTS